MGEDKGEGEKKSNPLTLPSPAMSLAGRYDDRGEREKGL